ncbi:unnamed protein product [Scytosiphon promiscuus]
MASDLSPKAKSKLVIRYSGEKLEARQVDGKVWFAVDGQAILTRQHQEKRQLSQQQLPSLTAGSTASIHVVLDGHSHDSNDGDRLGGVSPRAGCSPQESALLVKTAQLSPNFAAVTALPPGVHVMCHVPPANDVEERGPVGGQAESAGRWSTLWDDLRVSADAAEDTERLVWQAPCLRLLSEAGISLGSQSISSLADGVSPKGWALVPCTSSENLVCALARGRGPVEGGKVACHGHYTPHNLYRFPFPPLRTLVPISDAEQGGPTYASISAQHRGDDDVEVIAEAHRVLPGGVLSGYDLNTPQPIAGLESGVSSGGIAGSGKPIADDVLFVDESAAPPDLQGSWRGDVKIEELPGGGLHRHVRIKFDVGCTGEACPGSSGGGQSEGCEVLLAQHVSQGAYIDVDEVKARHDFDVRSSAPSGRRVGVETFEGKPIDIELPSSVSGQHIVNFGLWADMSKGRDRGGEGGARVRAEMTVPVHLRYPDPGCERRGEECEEYAWVKVPPPLASIRCGGPDGMMGRFSPVLPSMPPLGIALRVPRGIIWHRDFVMWGTVGAATLGCIYTIWTLLSLNVVGTARDSDRKRR